MTKFKLFVKLVEERCPGCTANDFNSINGVDLTWQGLYQNGYGLSLTTSTFHDAGIMPECVRAAFELWRSL